jgi:hypothetical protein
VKNNLVKGGSDSFSFLGAQGEAIERDFKNCRGIYPIS